LLLKYSVCLGISVARSRSPSAWSMNKRRVPQPPTTETHSSPNSASQLQDSNRDHESYSRLWRIDHDGHTRPSRLTWGSHSNTALTDATTPAARPYPTALQALSCSTQPSRGQQAKAARNAIYRMQYKPPAPRPSVEA
jgi:hypothetical protein